MRRLDSANAFGRRRETSGYALILVLLFTGISLLILGGALNWSSTNATLTARHIQYYNTLAAAEAATEKVIANMEQDYQLQGEEAITNNLTAYRGMVPTTNESPAWADVVFSNGQGQDSQIYLEGTNHWSYQALDSQFSGLYGSACAYRIIANARSTYSYLEPLTVALQQDIVLASIPIFQFAIFYTVDLEINPETNMQVTGRVHSNADLYTEPQDTVSLVFQSDVTAVGQIIAQKKPGDPQDRTSSYNVMYLANQKSKYNALTLPIGTNNAPDAVHTILEIPPRNEPVNSAMGKQRYFNKADLIILVTPNVCRVESGRFNNFATIIPTNQWGSFMNTSASFYNKREGKTIKATEIDIGMLKRWSETNTMLREVLGHDIRLLYVADLRSQTNGNESGVRLVNGAALPAQGFTVATPNPLYIKGNYNAPSDSLGTTNTTKTVPASLIGDAITILSSSWSDTNSSQSIKSRVAGDTTINAALLAGIRPTEGGYYSGGVENFPRLLEDWSGKTLTYNGSMSVMFYSRMATMPWGGAEIYSPPRRNWSLDLNFLDPMKLPPGTPEVRAIVRRSWTTIAPNTPNARAG